MRKIYFKHDNDYSEDARILSMRMDLGWEGYGVYWGIIEMLHKNNGYVDYSSQKISFVMGVNVNMVKRVCEDFGLFMFEAGRIYSEDLINHIHHQSSIVEKRREAGKKGGRPSISKKELSLFKEAKEPVIDERKKQKSMDERQSEFKNSLIPFIEKYGSEMVKKFWLYWSEPNKENTKMRFELEKTWHIGRRLATWSGNDFGIKSISQTYKPPMFVKSSFGNTGVVNHILSEEADWAKKKNKQKK